VHRVELDQAPVLDRAGQELLLDRGQRRRGLAAPAHLLEPRQPLVQPHRDGVVGGVADHVVDVLVDQGVEPRIAGQGRARRHQHQLLVLRQRDRAGGLDLGLGQRRQLGQIGRRAEDLDADLGGRAIAEIVAEPLPRQVEGGAGQVDQHLVDARGVGQLEPPGRRVAADEASGQVAGPGRQGPQGADLAADLGGGQAVEVGHCRRVVAVEERDSGRQPADLGRGRRALGQLGDRRPGLGQSGLVEQAGGAGGVARQGRIAPGRGRGGQRGQERHDRQQASARHRIRSS
jgi:hypothetical protein